MSVVNLRLVTRVLRETEWRGKSNNDCCRDQLRIQKKKGKEGGKVTFNFDSHGLKAMYCILLNRRNVWKIITAVKKFGHYILGFIKRLQSLLKTKRFCEIHLPRRHQGYNQWMEIRNTKNKNSKN